VPLAIRLTVVSWPATRSRNAIAKSSSSVSLSSASSAWTNAVMRSSWESTRRRSRSLRR
jgi:hypothetical protein